jgi:hypothetical protein
LTTHNHGAYHPDAERHPACETTSPGRHLSDDSAPCDHGETLTPPTVLTTRMHAVGSVAVRIVWADLFSRVRVPTFDLERRFSGLDRLDAGLCLPLRI